jgi:hypothetical protein
MESHYLKQVSLLVRILPFIAQEKDVALHGGTALNLFYFDMPRLSVDIDLTYLPFHTREKDLLVIEDILQKLKQRLIKFIPGIKVVGPKPSLEEYKLFCNLKGTEVKIEVNTINRGAISRPNTLALCKSAQQQFNTFCEIPVVPREQLFGGKMVAALDRQHPRDIFDVKNIMDTFDLSEDIIGGFVFCLLSSKRPFQEILNPSLLDQNVTINSQFSGMTNTVFTYEMFQETRALLIEKIVQAIQPNIAEALIDIADGNISMLLQHYISFPGVQWKLLNIQKLKADNSNKHHKQVEALRQIFKRK